MCKILSRIKEISEKEGITIAAMEQSIGASRGVISKAIAKGTDIQSKWLELLCDNFPQISPTWLLTGEGEMITEENPTSATSSEKIITETRPHIPFDAAAGGLSVALGSVSEDDCERLPLIPSFPKYDFTITARGDSMEPQFMSGDTLACLFIKESSFIQWGRAHVLDTAQGIVVKRIYNKADAILCKSNNPDYPDFEIPKDEIYRIALVVGYIRIE